MHCHIWFRFSLATSRQRESDCDEAEVLLAGRGRRGLKQFEAFDELSHEREIESLNCVAEEVVIRISEAQEMLFHEGSLNSRPSR